MLFYGVLKKYCIIVFLYYDSMMSIPCLVDFLSTCDRGYDLLGEMFGALLAISEVNSIILDVGSNNADCGNKVR